MISNLLTAITDPKLKLSPYGRAIGANAIDSKSQQQESYNQ